MWFVLLSFLFTIKYFNRYNNCLLCASTELWLLNDKQFVASWDSVEEIKHSQLGVIDNILKHKLFNDKYEHAFFTF